MIKTDNVNGKAPETYLTERKTLRKTIEAVVGTTPVIDIHTHLFAPEFVALNLFGIDELLTYHYLIAELFRSTDLKPDFFWRLTKKEKADLVWRTLFVENSPLSEATLGVITILSELGLDPNAENLDELREFFTSQKVSDYIDLVVKKSNVSHIVMTNDPFDSKETLIWDGVAMTDKRFSAALRLDPLLNDWAQTAAKNGWSLDLNKSSVSGIRRFLDQWIFKMKPLYMAVSLPDDFDYFADDVRNKLIRETILPTARTHNLPLTLMVGVRRSVNPALRAGGDGVGRSDLLSLEKLCLENPDVRFLATYLSRENQHELCVSARKFSNLMPFGCWWFMNNPSIISEITRERIELLGTSFIPQHSDARVLEQLIYKWKHSRRVIAGALYENYEKLLNAGRRISRAEIERDVTRLFSGNFQTIVNPAAEPAFGNNGKHH